MRHMNLLISSQGIKIKRNQKTHLESLTISITVIMHDPETSQQLTVWCTAPTLHSRIVMTIAGLTADMAILFTVVCNINCTTIILIILMMIFFF